VDEKERRHGNDPEKDFDNQRFLEYMKRFVYSFLERLFHCFGKDEILCCFSFTMH